MKTCLKDETYKKKKRNVTNPTSNNRVKTLMQARYVTGVSRCGIAPGRRKRKQGNIKPRLKHSAALPTLCGRM
jgi:hypothetical protein